MTSQSGTETTTASRLPKIGFGTYLISDEDAPGAITAAIDAGYRHIDTAAAYWKEAGVRRASSKRLGLPDSAVRSCS